MTNSKKLIETAPPLAGRRLGMEARIPARAPSSVLARRSVGLRFSNPNNRVIVAIARFLEDDAHGVHYLRHPIGRAPDFEAASVNQDLSGLVARAAGPS